MGQQRSVPDKVSEDETARDIGGTLWDRVGVSFPVSIVVGDWPEARYEHYALLKIMGYAR